MKKILMLLFLGNVSMAAVGINRTPEINANPDNFILYAKNPSANLAIYQGGTQTDRQVKKDDEEITVKTKDGIKVKAQPGKSKVETANYETKIKGDERKYKSKTDNTKIKTEPGKAKYETDNTKVKIKEKD